MLSSDRTTRRLIPWFVLGVASAIGTPAGAPALIAHQPSAMSPDLPALSALSAVLDPRRTDSTPSAPKSASALSDEGSSQASPATRDKLGEQSALDLRPCHLDGLSEAVECGRFSVWEDRDAGQGLRLDLAVTVVAARTGRPAPDPLVLLAGGPGQAARDLVALADRVFGNVRRDRDLVLVDLRGTGDSSPIACPDAIGEAAGSDPESMRRAAEACAARHGDRDLTRYGHEDALADLAEVLDALDYPVVNLWGGSFGTRAAIRFATRYPARVRSLVLDAPAPPELRFPLYAARDTDRVLDKLFDSCADDRACSARYPKPLARLERLLARLESTPYEGVHLDPVTGRSERVSITHDDFVNALRGWFYVPAHTALVPLVIDRAADGDFAPYLALVGETFAWSVDTMSLGVTLSIVCGEEIPRIDEPSIAESTAGTTLGRAFVDAWLSMCEAWPVGPPPTDLDTATTLASPALILTGDYDPITPPSWGKVMARRFSSARVLTLAGGGHTVSGSGCFPSLIAEFVSTPDPEALDAACLDRWRRPAIVLDASGSTTPVQPTAPIEGASP